MFAFSILLAIGDFPKPVVSLNPSYGAFLGGESTSVSCSCQCPVTRIHSCYNSKCREAELSEGQCETSFPLKYLRKGKTSYNCECFLQLENGTWRRSGMTDPIQIRVGDELSKPMIKVLSDSGSSSSGDYVVISCKGDIRPRGGIFNLCHSQKNDFTQERPVSGVENIAFFTINIHEPISVGNYSCQYETEVNGHVITSPFSQSVAVVERGKEGHTSKDAQMRLYLYVGLGCTAVIIVVLCLIIIKKGRYKSQTIQRTAPSAVQNTHDGHDRIYYSANLIHHRTMDEYSDVHGNKCEGVTYAALNMDGLSQNEAASVNRGETCVYMDVKN
ncbi:uncharacterized protein LOC125487947 isoform X2 [Rhincodon typus]|uniref:uncharacterized protein LOC125487947 isoform X2 n=1 Tax=Rhincodon typus TaxID=259920 RepID=UPI00202E9334|nr:uncharacterized protein LOC125487947 isoform X2 [Rhincodon typus]